MLYSFGDWVLTKDNKIGIITVVHQFTRQYFVAFKEGGRLYEENEVVEWSGVW